MDPWAPVDSWAPMDPRPLWTHGPYGPWALWTWVPREPREGPMGPWARDLAIRILVNGVFEIIIWY